MYVTAYYTLRCEGNLWLSHTLPDNANGRLTDEKSAKNLCPLVVRS